MGAMTDFFGNSGNTNWSITSNEDTRWNCSGKGGSNVVNAKLKELDDLYGERPKDLNLSVFKD